MTGTLQKKVYFLTGHGESSIYSDYASAVSALRDNLFQVGELDLLRGPGVPKDAAVVILAGPKKPAIGSEVKALKMYLENGGRMFVLVNPNPPEWVRQLVSEWGVDVKHGTVIDPSSYVSPNKDTPLAPAIRNYFGLSESYFPGCYSRRSTE